MSCPSSRSERQRWCCRPDLTRPRQKTQISTPWAELHWSPPLQLPCCPLTSRLRVSEQEQYGEREQNKTDSEKVHGTNNSVLPCYVFSAGSSSIWCKRYHIDWLALLVQASAGTCKGQHHHRQPHRFEVHSAAVSVFGFHVAFISQRVHLPDLDGFGLFNQCSKHLLVPAWWLICHQVPCMNVIYCGSFSKGACTSSTKLLKLLCKPKHCQRHSAFAQLEGDGNQKS